MFCVPDNNQVSFTKVAICHGIGGTQGSHCGPLVRCRHPVITMPPIGYPRTITGAWNQTQAFFYWTSWLKCQEGNTTYLQSVKIQFVFFLRSLHYKVKIINCLKLYFVIQLLKSVTFLNELTRALFLPTITNRVLKPKLSPAYLPLTASVSQRPDEVW